MLGLKVIEVEGEWTDRSTWKEWVAPDLHCFALKRQDFDDGELRTNSEVVSIDLREPDQAFFEVPAGYELVSPLEMETRYRTRFPGRDLFGLFAYKLEDRYQLATEAAKNKQ